MDRDEKPRKARRRDKGAGEPPTEDGSRSWRFRLRGDFLAASVLSLLRRRYSHGYRLANELVKAGLPMFDSATLYRTLRDLERAGLVSSFWDTSSAGPARRMYSLTRTGEVFLSLWVETLQRYQKVFRRAAKEYDVDSEESAEALPPPRPRRGASPKRTRRRSTPSRPPPNDTV